MTTPKTLFVSPITQVIADTTGLAVRLEALTPIELHPDLHDIARAKGIYPEGEVHPVQEEETPDQELSLLDKTVAAVRQLMAEGDQKAFTTNGEPKLTELRKIAGADVTDALRDEAWAIVSAE